MKQLDENRVLNKDVTKISDTAVTKIGDARSFLCQYLCGNFKTKLFIKC